MVLCGKTYASVALGCILAVGAFLFIATTPMQPQVFDEHPLVVRLWTDKMVGHVGETVYWRHEFYNPNPFPVTFTPPRVIRFTDGFAGEEKGWGTYTVPWVEQPDGDVTIPTFGTYIPCEIEVGFSVRRVGFYEISCMGAVVEVKIIP